MLKSAGDRQSAIASAKINLSLQVVGKRADGFHDLQSVVAKVTLYDGIDLFDAVGAAIQIECSHPAIPSDAPDLIWQAIQRLQRRAGCSQALRVRLAKRIPVGAGLGGGSSDAATVLQLVNRRWDLRIGLQEMTDIASRIGSDVPLFLVPGSCAISGRGDKVESVVLPWHGWAVLVFPPFGLSTAAVYQAWRPDCRRHGDAARQCLEPHYDTAEKLDEVLFNDLEPSAWAVEPRLQELGASLQTRTQRKFHISGSGSTLFACLDSYEEAHQLDQRIGQDLGVHRQVVRVINEQDKE